MAIVFKKLVVLLVGLVTLGGLAACGGSSTDTWNEEVAKAGFSDPVAINETTRRIVILASAGTCRLRFVADIEASRLYVTVPDGPIEEPDSFIGDPSLALLQGDERFSACFSSEEKQS